MKSTARTLLALAAISIAPMTMADSTTGLGCDGDCTGDGQVNVDDLLSIIGDWGQNGCDVDGNGITGVDELLQILNEWNATCHPFLQDHPQGLTVEFDYDAGFAIVMTTGLAEHEMGPFDGSTECSNPNTPSDQNRTLMIPLVPVPTNTPEVSVLDTLGPIGVWYNGVAFYNPYDGGTQEAPGNICMDPYNGHPSPDGSYHYHQYSPFPNDDGDAHSPIVGYGYDGYPVYGPWDGPGILAAVSENPLDDCNGHFDAARGYHYHSISYDMGVEYGLPGEGFPWILGCYRGEPELSNFDNGGPPPPPGGGCDGCAGSMIPPTVCNCVHTTPGYEYCCDTWDADCQAYADANCGGGGPP
jgi:hypothetical protein